jgi:hypothetical protein
LPVTAPRAVIVVRAANALTNTDTDIDIDHFRVDRRGYVDQSAAPAQSGARAQPPENLLHRSSPSREEFSRFISL